MHDFFNEGFGWICRQCDRELGEPSPDTPSRLMQEGEAESKQPQFSNRALAKWADPERRTLTCPLCGISERIDIS